MSRRQAPPRLGSVLFFGLMILATLFIVLIAGFVFYRDYFRFQEESEMIREQYTEAQKNLIKAEVDKAFYYIQYMLSIRERRLRETIKDRTLEAHAIGMHLAERYQGKMRPEEIKSLIIEALRAIRFHDGRGYYFATSLDGVEILFADRPELEGKDLLEMQDTQGQYVIRDMIRIARDQGEGFYTYSWTKPASEGRGFPKIAYIKYFAPFNGFIGTGEYLDDVEKDIQREVLDRIGHIRFGQDGYIFVVSYDGVTLMNSTQPHLISKNIWDMTDPFGVKVIQEERRAVENPEGDYIYYHWEKPTTGIHAPKVSFMKGIPEWRWMIGAGVYLDEVESIIQEKEAALRREVMTNLKWLGIFFLFVLALIYYLSYLVSHRFNRQIQVFLSFFRAMEAGGKPIDEAPLRIAEFRALAQSANVMLAKRREAETALRESQDRHRDILKTTLDGFWLLNSQGRLLEVNDSYCRMSGYSESELLAMSLTDIEATENPAGTMAHIRKIEQMGYDRFETRHRRKDGSCFDAEISVQFKATEGGNLVAFIRDITESKRAERERGRLQEQLTQAQKMESIGRLAGGVAHDFNNLLTGISGNVALAMMDLSPDDPLYELLTEVSQAADSAAGLTRQLLAFSRKQLIEPKVLDLNEIIDRSHRMLRRLIGEDIDLVFTPGRDIGSVKIDPGQVEQILVNLAVNGRDALPDGGHLTLETANVFLDDEYCRRHGGNLTPGEYVMLAVSDDGVGMDPEVRRHLFEPFFTTKEKGKGTGLGLATVYGAVKQNEGNIEVYSEPGRGTTFKIYLPQVSAEAEKLIQPIDEHMPTGTETVVVVEDEPMVRNMAVKILKRQGYHVFAFANGIEAVQSIRQMSEPLHLLMTDVVMPGMNGKELAQTVQALRPEIKVLYASGYTENAIAHHGVLDEGIEFIGKPYAPQALAVKVRAVLDK